MALYDGFFDAVLDEDTYQYDREYNSGDFTGYFEEVVGSGVCVHVDESSMRVSWSGSAAVVAPGYLFIRGYWLKNTANYSIPISGEGTHAVLAQLNTTARHIEVETVPKADPEEYPDALLLAYVTIDSAGAATVEDTRYNTDICGVIDSAGGLSAKVEYAINYINNEIDGKLAEAEAAIEAQALLLDAKIEEVNAMAEKLTPPPIGTVKFSASQDVGDGWLRCNGEFISETDYPELVAALGKKYPSGDKFVMLSEGEIGANITNGVLYGGRLWVYSYAAGKLYGVDVDGNLPVKEITFSSADQYFGTFLPPTDRRPLALSITDALNDSDSARVFLAQYKGGISPSTLEQTEMMDEEEILIFVGVFDPEAESIEMTRPFVSIVPSTGGAFGSYFTYYSIGSDYITPYIVSALNAGEPVFYCAASLPSKSDVRAYSTYIFWGTDITQNAQMVRTLHYDLSNSTVYGWEGQWYTTYQRGAFSKKNNNEFVIIVERPTGALSSSPTNKYSISSFPNGLYSRVAASSGISEIAGLEAYPGTITLAGDTSLLGRVDTIGTSLVTMSRTELDNITQVFPGVSLPSGSRVFADSSAYLWGKKMFVIFVGSGILFSRDLSAGSFGFLNTVDTLGLISQYGYLDYSVDENTLYLVGQDSANRIKIAKMELNTLFDYSTDGAWLPLIASDGIPAYIKAYEPAEEA